MGSRGGWRMLTANNTYSDIVYYQWVPKVKRTLVDMWGSANMFGGTRDLTKVEAFALLMAETKHGQWDCFRNTIHTMDENGVFTLDVRDKKIWTLKHQKIDGKNAMSCHIDIATISEKGFKWLNKNIEDKSTDDEFDLGEWIFNDYYSSWAKEQKEE